MNYLEEIIELPDNEVDRIDLEAAIAEFDSRLSALDEVQLLVEMNLPDEDSMCADLDEAAEIRNRVKKTKLKATQLLLRLTSDSQNEEGKKPANKVPTGSALQTNSKTGCGFCSKDHPTWLYFPAW